MVAFAQRLTRSTFFNNLIIGLIIATSVITGLLTYPEIASRWYGLLHTIDLIILWGFALEIVLRIIAAWPRPADYFKSGWNLFDLFIVVVSLLPYHAEAAAVFRLARVLRALRLLKAVPKLQVIVGAMLSSLSSLGYVALILMIHFYVYAVIGVSLFGKTDPAHFGTVGSACLTLFQIVTLEGWVDVMRTQLDAGLSPLWVPAYFVSFILLGTMIILNLGIGVIINGIMETHEEIALELKDLQRADNRPIDSLGRLEKQLGAIQEEIASIRRRLDSSSGKS